MPKHQQQPLRCPWPGIENPEYARYHDEEWGVPHADDQRLFEKLILEGFQAGLSWLTILKKRDNFRAAFHNFDAERIARYRSNDIARLMRDAGIIRNRLKIEATIDNAKVFLKLQEGAGFAAFLWSEIGDRPIINHFEALSDVPSQTPNSKALSNALKGQGFRFVGPTTLYAFMQSVGMVNDHLVSCRRHKVCAERQRRWRYPSETATPRTR